jgi:predicted amidohydrolase YtcJ
MNNIWLNGNIWREKSSPAEAIAFAQGRILAVGSTEELRTRFGPAQELDLQGAWLYPGFRDPHAHLLNQGLASYQADLNGCSTPLEAVERLQQFVAGNSEGFGSGSGTGSGSGSLIGAGSSAEIGSGSGSLISAGSKSGPSGEWVIGRDWNDALWTEGAVLDRDMLDQVFPDRPVYLSRIDRHAAIVNSEALRRAGISRAVPVSGGKIGSYPGTERPNGLLVDEAMMLVFKEIPSPGPDQEREALLRAQAHCFAEGLVGVADMGLDQRQYEVIKAAQKEGSLLIPIYGTLTPEPETEAHYRREGPFFGERLTIRAFKYYADGALGSRGARLLEPYSDAPEQQGLWMHQPEYLHQQARLNAAQGFQTVTHAIGDAAVRLVLDVVQKNAPAGDHRWRVEHAQIVHPGDLTRFAQLGAWASIQACHGVSDQKMAVMRLGADRLQHAYRGRSLLDAGARMVNGTDFPIEPVSALRSFTAACLRAERSGSAPAFRPEEALTRLEALLAMTAWAADAQFQEHECGRLEPGYWADFTVLDTDLMDASAAELSRAQVLRTVVRGDSVYNRSTGVV